MIDFQALRNKILNKAIRGELVPQLETEPAVEAFADELEDVPFVIPAKWKWVCLCELIEKMDYGTSVKCHIGKSKDDIPILRMGVKRRIKIPHERRI